MKFFEYAAAYSLIAYMVTQIGAAFAHIFFARAMHAWKAQLSKAHSFTGRLALTIFF